MICFVLFLLFKYNMMTVHAKPRLTQVNVRQKLYATGRNFGFTCHITGNFCQIVLYIQWCDRWKIGMTGKNLEIISQMSYGMKIVFA